VKILLILKAHRGAGALAGVAEALTGHGFYVDEHKLIPRDEETAEIRVLASGEGDFKHLPEKIEAVSAVIELVEIRELSATEVPAQPDAAPERPRDPWVERLIREWPNVLPLLKEFSAPLGETDCEHELTCLGIDAGAAIYGRRSASDPPTSVEAGLKQIVAPALTDVAKTKARGNTLRVMETDLASSEGVDLMFLPVEDKPYCCFLSGLIAGMLNAIPGMPRVRVEETRCLARGDHFCDFKVTEIG
jgi:hypothetical protein